MLFADRVIVLGTNPGRVNAEIAIDLARPRDRRTPEFEALLDRIYGIMTGREIEEAPPRCLRGASIMLPHASVDGFSGLLEILRDAGGVADLADLADDLSLEVDDLLPLVDACLLLGFVSAHDGELRLTEDGRRFADADIQSSKQLFARVALERVPLVRTIRNALARADDGALKEAFFSDLLRRQYSADEAHAQLETAIDWGRYGELYEYAADTAEITRNVGGLDPVAALEQQVEPGARRQHQRERERVADDPLQLGHVGEVHPVDRPDDRRGEEDRRPGRDLLDLLVLLDRRLAEDLRLEREVDAEDVLQQLAEARRPAPATRSAWSCTSRR